MEQLYEISQKRIQQIATTFKRSLYEKIDFNQRLTEILGSRGIAKFSIQIFIPLRFTPFHENPLELAKNTSAILLEKTLSFSHANSSQKNR